MPLKLTTTDCGPYVRYELAGSWDRAAAATLVDQLAGELIRRKADRVLVDMTRVIGPIPPMDRFQMAERTATLTRGRLRIAIVDSPQFITKLFEDTAVNRGASVRVTADEGEALAYLLGTPPDLAYIPPSLST